MLDHHIQRTIINRLAYTPSASFTQLKPDDIENKLFTYHLKKTVNQGYVQKSADGQYSLTPEGRRLSTGVHDKQQELIVERPLSVFFLVIQRKDGSWLQYTRKTHPMLGYSGFIHVRPNASGDVQQIAKEQVKLKTGLDGDFTPLGGGYARVFENDILESYTHFTLLYCEDIQGELNPTDDHANYFWVTDETFSDRNMFPLTPILRDLYKKRQPFFIDETFRIASRSDQVR